uniref:Uncharacterized protein n=1 Tax=Cucumis melo TaxID=3656 RepID=A0A9I9DDU1_CUCME
MGESDGDKMGDRWLYNTNQNGTSPLISALFFFFFFFLFLARVQKKLENGEKSDELKRCGKWF